MERTMNKPLQRAPHRSAAPFALGAALAGSILLGACASTPPPTEQMAVSEAALGHALGAGAVALAPAQMRSAQDKLHRASVAMIAKDHDSARMLAEQAQVDAQLAEVMARSSKATQASDAVRDGSRALREEIERKSR
jgi:hypothetical protein